MITITTRTDAVALAGDLDKLRTAAPRAIVRALTATANAAVSEVQAEMRKVFDRPTPFTLRAVRRVPASEQTLESRVFLVEDTNYGSGGRNFLYPQIEGGTRRQKGFERALQRIGVLPAGWFVIPGRDAKLDAFGNWQRGEIIRLLSYFQAFGEQGFRSNTSKAGRDKLRRGTRRRVVGQSYFAVVPGRSPAGRWLHPGIYGVVHLAGRSYINPVAIFVRNATYRPKLDFYGTVERTAKARFPIELRRILGAEATL